MSEESGEMNSAAADARIRDRMKESELWMRYAQDDFALVQHLYYGDYYPKPLEIICYHSQQTAEKAVKALIVALGSQGGMPKTHDIQFLLTQIKNILMQKAGTEIPEEIYDWAVELTKYSVVVRYPNEMEVDDERTRKAVEHSKAFFLWIKSILGQMTE